MKKLLLFLLLAVPAFGQITVVGGDPNMLLFPGTPTGSCLMPNLAQAQDTGYLYRCFLASWVLETGTGGGGSGDFSSSVSSSVDGEIVLYSGTGGKTGKRATGTGLAKITSGVLGTATSGTDYAPATSGTGILKGDGAGGFAAASAGTDYVIPAGNVATATALAANPTDCSANQYATAIAASGNLTCSQPALANLSDGTAAGIVAKFNSGTCSGFLKSDGTCAAAGTGTVTHTGGALTLNYLMAGAGTDDSKVTNLSYSTPTLTGPAGLVITSADTGTPSLTFGTNKITVNVPIESTPAGGVGGSFNLPEGTDPTVGAIGYDGCYASSASHAPLCKWNGGTYSQMATLADINKTRVCEVVIWGTGASNVLQDTDDWAADCKNKFGATWTVTAVECYADAGSPTFMLTKTGGNNVLTGNITCGTASYAAGTLTGTAADKQVAADGTLDFTVVSAGGAAHYIRVVVAGTI